MAKKTKETKDLDVKSPEFWDSMNFELIKVMPSGRILVNDKVTGSKMTFSANWTPFQIARTVSNARAQYLK